MQPITVEKLSAIVVAQQKPLIFKGLNSVKFHSFVPFGALYGKLIADDQSRNSAVSLLPVAAGRSTTDQAHQNRRVSFVDGFDCRVWNLVA